LLWGIAAALAVAVAAVVAFKAWPVLHPSVAERAPLGPACDLRAGPCSVQFASGGSVTLAIAPRAIPAVHPLELDVTLRDLPAPQRVEVDFAGVEMDMGFNRTALQRDADAPRPAGTTSGGDAADADRTPADRAVGPHPVGAVGERGHQDQDDGSEGFDNRAAAGSSALGLRSRWTGQGMLPVCVRERMTWEARVLLHYPDRLLAAPFRFDTLRPGAR
jgi:hypothetical protein